MDDINYDEVVTLSTPGIKKILTLDAAVREVIFTGDTLVRLSAVITRDGPPIMKFADIEVIYARADFPNR